MLRKIVVPLLAAVVIVVVPLTLILSFAERQYFDGLILPFITQAAREGASFWVFALGMTFVCGILIAIGRVTERWMCEVGSVMNISREIFGHRILVKSCCARFERFGQATRLCFVMSGLCFALCAWSNHLFFHKQRMVDLHSWITVGAFALSVTAMSINTYVTEQLCKLLKKGGCPSTPPELRALLNRSKRAKGIANVVINIAMLAHVPTTYVREWFCAGSLGPHAPRGSTFFSFAECESELGLSAAYCERWRDDRNSSMTLLFDPPDDACPSIGLSLYNAVTQYVVIATLLLFVLTLQIDLRYDPPAGELVVTATRRSETAVARMDVPSSAAEATQSIALEAI